MNIWPWSRIRELERANANLNRRLEAWEGILSARLNNTTHQISVITSGVIRIVAKLDPQISRNELSPEMRAESDKLTEEVINRLNAEQAVRDQYGYNPKEPK